jgi:hypothetical protein
MFNEIHQIRIVNGFVPVAPRVRTQTGSAAGLVQCGQSCRAGRGPQNARTIAESAATQNDLQSRWQCPSLSWPVCLKVRERTSTNPPTPQRQNSNSALRLLSKATKSLIHKHIGARLAYNAGRMNMRIWCELQGLSLCNADRISSSSSGRKGRTAMFRLCTCLNAAPAFGDGHGVAGNANMRSGVLKW